MSCSQIIPLGSHLTDPRAITKDCMEDGKGGLGGLGIEMEVQRMRMKMRMKMKMKIKTTTEDKFD